MMLNGVSLSGTMTGSRLQVCAVVRLVASASAPDAHLDWGWMSSEVLGKWVPKGVATGGRNAVAVVG